MVWLSDYIYGRIACPYFKGRKGKQAIVCDGFMPGTSLGISFDTSKGMTKYIDDFCARSKSYNYCLIADILNRMNDDE